MSRRCCGGAAVGMRFAIPRCAGLVSCGRATRGRDRANRGARPKGRGRPEEGQERTRKCRGLVSMGARVSGAREKPSGSAATRMGTRTERGRVGDVHAPGPRVRAHIPLCSHPPTACPAGVLTADKPPALAAARSGDAPLRIAAAAGSSRRGGDDEAGGGGGLGTCCAYEG